MGMAASQARLLTITARLADNELRSQTINNAKMRLATQSSQASENYINALNNATLKFASYDEAGNALSQDLTYNALTAYSSYNTQYGLINSAGQILVSESEAAIFAQANGNLNAYLLAHGLEYNTTYFDELGAIKNDIYPEPFNNISVEEMQTYYEQYGSYENSLEVENYTNNYSAFIKSENQLVKGAESSLESYLLYGSNTPAISIPEDETEYQYDYTSTISNMVGYFKEIFTASTISATGKDNNNTYNINSLKNNGILSDEYTEQVLELINDVKVGQFEYLDEYGKVAKDSNGNRLTKTGMLVTEDAVISPVKAGQTSYELVDGLITVTVDADGKVTAVTPNTDELTGGESFELTGPKDSNGNDSYKGMSFVDCVNNLSYKITTPKNGDTPESYSEFFLGLKVDENGDYSATTHSALFTVDSVKEALKGQTDAVINTILSLANYENFAEFILEMPDPSAFGIDVNKIIPSVNKTLKEILTNYKDSKNSFLNNIFEGPILDPNADTSDPNYLNNPDNYLTKVEIDGVLYKSSKDYIEAAMKNGAEAYVDTDVEPAKKMFIIPENLRDIHFVLRLLQEKGLQQSASFDTVIKEYLVEELIAVYGEPKYAWIDLNDTGNTGNADAKAQWYTNLFNRMNQGYKALENGLGASKEWMEYALESGIVTIEQVDKNFKWNGLDYRTCVKITEETDQAAVAKAEAEYNRAMNDIEAKDNIFDMELKNIDTEHNALQTEYDVIKGVIDKNISRTFKFNQSA